MTSSQPARPARALSIVTAVLNGAAYIKSCLSCVAEEDPHAEHVIVDGGSCDGTVEIVRDWADHHPSVRWISEPDSGLSEALNKGVRMASGSVLGWLNVDDYYEPGAVRRAAGIVQGLPEPALVVGDCNVWDEAGRLLFVNRPRRLDIASLLVGWEHAPHPINPAAYFWHRSLLDRIGPFDEGEKFAMDVDFLLRAVQVAHVVYVDETWGNYRFRPGSLTYHDMIVTGESGERLRRLHARHRARLEVLARARHEMIRARYEARSLVRRVRGVLRRRTEV